MSITPKPKAPEIPRTIQEFNLLDLAQAINKEENKRDRHSILIYGDSRSGKTQLAGTLSKVPQIKTINWFDGENGSDTLVQMFRTGKLTQEQAQKFRIFKIRDLPDKPYFMETMLKVLTDRKTHKICNLHGRSSCPDCLPDASATWKDFCNYNQDYTTWNVLDSGSQLATSVMALLCKGQEPGFKPGWDEYGPQGRMLSDMLTVIQSGVANWLVITHILMLEQKDVDKKLVSDGTANAMFDKIYPLMGTKNFSANVSKFFGTTIYLEKKMNKHRGGSSSTYKSDALAGSRVGMRIEDEEEMDLSLVFPKLGIYGQASVATAVSETKKQ